MTTFEIEGVKITPEILECMKDMQENPEYLIKITDRTIDHLLSLSDMVSHVDTLSILRSVHLLKKQLLILIPNGDE